MPPEYANPQDLNLYSYVHNNPVRYNDPSGHCIPGIGDCQLIGSISELNYHDAGQVFAGAVEGAASVVTGVVMAPVALAQAASNPAAAVAGLQEQAATVVRGAQFLASDPSGAAAALNNDPRGVGRVLGTAAGTAALALAGGEASAASEAEESEASAACAFNSFRADTPVATTNGEQPIGSLQVGDQVIAYNERLQANGVYTITAVLVHIDPTLIDLTLDSEPIETTPHHPFYTVEQGWVDAGVLWIGAHVRKVDGSAGIVRSLHVVQRPQTMYNLTVAKAHTFFVGSGKWLVHNTCLQTGGNTVKPNTAKQLNKANDLDLHPREWGRALEALKKDLGLGNNHHGKIMDTADYLDAATDEHLGNLLDYLP